MNTVRALKNLQRYKVDTSMVTHTTYEYKDETGKYVRWDQIQTMIDMLDDGVTDEDNLQD